MSKLYTCKSCPAFGAIITVSSESYTAYVNTISVKFIDVNECTRYVQLPLRVEWLMQGDQKFSVHLIFVL